MNPVKLEQELQNLSDALSEFDDALTDFQMKSVPSPNMRGVSHQRLLSEIDSDTSELSRGVGEIGEKVEQLNRLSAFCDSRAGVNARPLTYTQGD